MTDDPTDFSLAMAALGENSPTAIAKALGGSVTRQVVEHWQSKGSVPAEKAPLVERACRQRGCMVSVDALCPGKRWVRLKDKQWPHPDGRPLLDLAEPAKVAA